MMMANNHLCVLGPHVKPYYSLTCSSVQFMKICAVWVWPYLCVIKQWDRIVYCSRVRSASQHNKHNACIFMNMNEAVNFGDSFYILFLSLSLKLNFYFVFIGYYSYRNRFSMFMIFRIAWFIQLVIFQSLSKISSFVELL